VTTLKHKNQQLISLIKVDVVVCLRPEWLQNRFYNNLPEKDLCRSTKT
jgi:hypothetical protein